MRRRVLILIAFGLGYAAVIALMYWRAWRGQIANFDCTNEYWPDLEFQLGAFRHGEMPLWNPYSLGGYSFAGDVQAGTYSPLNWVCWLIGAFTGPSPWLIQIKIWLGLWVALVGMHLLVWRRTRFHVAACIAALTYVFGAPLLIHKNGAYLWSFLWLPWVIIALERFTDAPSVRRGAGVAAGLWLVGTAGHPHGFFISLLTLGGLWVVRLAAKPGWRSALRTQLPGLGVAALLAVLLLASTYVPAIDAIAYSPRASRSLGWVLNGGMTNAQYGALFVADATHNWAYDVYMGPLAMMAPIVLVAMARSRAERLDRGYWIGVAILGLWLASGGWMLRLFAEYIPGFGLFRVANRWKAMAALPIAVLVGEAVAVAIRGSKWRWWRQTWIGAGTVILAGAVMIAFRPLELVLEAVVLAAVLAIVIFPRWMGSIGPALVAFVLLDLFNAGWSKMSIVESPPGVHSRDSILARMDDGDTLWRYIDTTQLTLPPWLSTVRERREFSGQENPIVILRRDEIDQASKKQPLLLTHFNIRWYIGRAPPGAQRDSDTRFFEYTGAAPVVRWYGRGVVAAPDVALAVLSVTAPEILQVAFIDPEPNPGPLPKSVGAPVDGQVISFSRNEISVEVDCPEAGIVVINEPWFPGWQISVDGAPARLLRANYLLRGVVVPPGDHVVSMRFAPRGYPYVQVAFALGLLVTVSLLAGVSSRTSDQVPRCRE